MDTGADLGPRSDETLDLLFGERVALIQARRGYRTSVDALILAWAGAQLMPATVPARGLDMGCGVGLVGVLAALALPASTWALVDVQPQQIERAVRNVRRNGVADRCSVQLADLADAQTIGHCDIVLCNPPFRNTARHTPSVNRERQLSNFESTATLERMVEVAFASLTPGGRAVFVYPWTLHLRVRLAMAAAGAQVTVCAVRHHPSAPPVRALVVGTRDADVTRPPCLPAELAVHPSCAPDSVYGPEIARFLAGLGVAANSAGSAHRDKPVAQAAAACGQICGPLDAMLA